LVITEGGKGKRVVNLTKLEYEAEVPDSIQVNFFPKVDDNETQNIKKS
jgi:hypothetical protein